MSKSITDQLEDLVSVELKFQDQKCLKKEYDEDFTVSCGRVMGLYKAINLINENKNFELSVDNMLRDNQIN